MKSRLIKSQNRTNNHENCRRPKERWFNKNPKQALLVAFFSLLFAIFLIVEIGLRIRQKEFRIINFQAQGINILKSYYPARFDKLLGYIPKEYHGASPGNLLNKRVTIIRDGVRSNDNAVNPNSSHHRRVVILAVGDSFTFGDEVSNQETWPAYLEDITAARVINGGVFGYGLDQTVLRAEDLIKKYQPNILIVSFIKDDLSRCGLKVRTNIPKPYYAIKNNELVLINSHLSEKEIAKLEQKNILLKVLGYSFFIHTKMSEYAPLYWFLGALRYEEESGEDYRKIAVLLMAKLKKISNDTSTKVIIMPQYVFDETDFTVRELNYVKKAAAAAGLEVIDLFDKIITIKTTDYPKYQDMYIKKGHMSPEGNKWIAAELAQYLYLNKLLP